MHSLSYRIELFLLLIIQFIFSILPRFITLRIGTFIGRILYMFKAYEKTIYGNMSYSEYWTEEEIKKLIPGIYRQMGRYISDFLRISSAVPPYRLHSFDIIEKKQAENRGLIAILAHIGNWEMLANLFGKQVNELHVIAKPMKNRYVDNWLTAKRESTGVKTIFTQHALRKMIEALTKKKGIVAILIDQHGGKHGTMIPFLGKDANTVRTVAGIVQKTNCAVAAAYSIMQEDGSYDIYIEEVPALDMSGLNDNQAIEMYQKQHNEIISSWIRKYPTHYFGWFHKRFRGIIPYK